MIYSANRRALSSGSVRHVDDFRMRISPPHKGIINLNICIVGCKTTGYVLRAENDDLMRLKLWMEDVVRKEHASVKLSYGQKLEYHVTNVPESSVEPTERFIDELFPSPIGILTLSTNPGESLECLVKVKHFLNLLYLHILTQGRPDWYSGDNDGLYGQEWYKYVKCEDITLTRFQQKNGGFCHYNRLQSDLIEWYVSSSGSYVDQQPFFRRAGAITGIVSMWDDCGELFWSSEGGIGDASSIGIGEDEIDLSGIGGLRQWVSEYDTSIDRIACDVEEYEDTVDLTPSEKEWIIRGYQLAQQVSRRLPLNVVLVYKQYVDFEFIVGHIIFNPNVLLNAKTT